MRWVLTSLLLFMVALTVVAYSAVRPVQVTQDALAIDFFAIGDDPRHPDLVPLMQDFRERIAPDFGLEPFASYAELLERPAGERARYDNAFVEYYRATTGRSLADVPTLVWSTDSNPARQVQMDLFRRWHLRTFGEPVAITADPANRELTKAIVQSVAGAGADIIEYYGPAELQSLAKSGIALDITEYAKEHGFGLSTVFPAVRSSLSVPNESGEPRQYAYACNVGYTCLLYHKDMFEQAGVQPPTGGWTFDELRSAADKVMAAPGLRVTPAFGFMNLGAWDAALGAGGRFFPEHSRAYSTYNSPETVEGFRAFRDLMYEHGTMPEPGEAASLSAGAGGSFGGEHTASAPGLFAQRSIVMYMGGRWEYVTFAAANRDRVIVPAIDRRLGQIDTGSREAKLLVSARELLTRDVLLPLTDAQSEAVRACLNASDRAQLLQIGVAHAPTATGTPFYSVAARGAVVNRALADTDPERLEYALRFMRFLGSETYNEQINGTFDSICGRIEYCVDDDGIAGPPAALPGLEGFDSPVFAEAVLEYGGSWQLSPYIGRNRLGTIAGDYIQRLESDALSPEDTAREIEEGINRQILANLTRDPLLRERWINETGIEPSAITPGLRDANGRHLTIREQIETRIGQRAAAHTTLGGAR